MARVVGSVDPNIVEVLVFAGPDAESSNVIPVKLLQRCLKLGKLGGVFLEVWDKLCSDLRID